MFVCTEWGAAYAAALSPMSEFAEAACGCNPWRKAKALSGSRPAASRHELLNNGDAKMPKRRIGPFPHLETGEYRHSRKTETPSAPRIWLLKAIICEQTGRDFPHQNKWLPGMYSNCDSQRLLAEHWRGPLRLVAGS
jgi:hypothetical protein